MKKLIGIIFAILIIFYLTACNSAKGPTDEEVNAAYQQAVEAYSWFDLSTMPLYDNSRIKYNGNVYDKVNYSGIQSLSDLETYLHSLFSDDVVDSLLKDNFRYIDIDGVLYAISADRGSNIFAGEEHHEIIRESDKKFIYKVTVDILDDNLEKVVDQEEYSFAYEFIDNKWKFTNFCLVR